MAKPLDMLVVLNHRLEAKWRAYERALQRSMPPAIIERTCNAYLDALEAYSKAKKQAQEQAKIN